MNIQSNSVNTDTEGDIESVRIKRVNLEKGLKRCLTVHEFHIFELRDKERNLCRCEKKAVKFRK